MFKKLDEDILNFETLPGRDRYSGIGWWRLAFSH